MPTPPPESPNDLRSWFIWAVGLVAASGRFLVGYAARQRDAAHDNLVETIEILQKQVERQAQQIEDLSEESRVQRERTRELEDLLAQARRRIAELSAGQGDFFSVSPLPGRALPPPEREP